MRKITAIFLMVTVITGLCACSLRPANGDNEWLTAPTVNTTSEINAEKQTTPETEAQTEPAPDVISKASFVGCGDNIIYFGTYRDAKAQAYAGGREYNFRPMYKNVEGIISAADIAFINQETVIAHSFPPESYPGFNSPVDIADDLVDVGFDVIGIANNHMLDKGAQGLRETYDNWNERDVTLIGCYEENESGRYISYTEKNGIKIAFIAYTYGTNLYEDPANVGLYAPYLKYSDVEGEIGEARENADFVIVSVHWGDEGTTKPNDEQKQYAQLMADSGADVIIGHHPHTLQPIEWLEGKDGNKALCAYSLGNFLHEQDWEYNVPGGILSFDIEKVNDGHATAENVRFIPTVCHYPSNFYNNTIYLLKDYTAELANAHAVRTYYNRKISLEGIVSLVKNTISDEFLEGDFE